VILQEPDNAQALATLAAKLAVYASNFLDTSSPRYQPMFTEAKALALRAKAIDDQLPFIYTALSGHASEIQKDLTESRRNFELAIKVAPKAPSGYNNLASWYYHDGQPKPAIELLNKALALYPKGSDVLFGNLSRCYLMLGDNAAAIEWGQRALDSGSTFYYVYSKLAMAYANLGRMDMARQYADKYKQRVGELGVTANIYKLNGSESPAFVKYYNEHILPEWRNAGLPE
jgi:tetratricopeptide (TPR) repeat protein